MKTNDLKRGARVVLTNGWEADIMDNMKGNTRLARVYTFLQTYKLEKYNVFKGQEDEH
jgi:hypothetical protein